MPASMVGQGQMAQTIAQQPAYPVQPAIFASVAPIRIPAQQPPRRQWQRATWISALSIFVVLIIISAVGLLSYTAVVRPAMLKVHATAVARTFLTAQAQDNSPQYIYQQATRGKPTISDPLNKQDTSIWNHDSPAQNFCGIVAETYHVFVNGKNSYNNCTSNLHLANFALQVQTTIFLGSEAGIVFRSVAAQRGYVFGITQWGNYIFDRSSDTISTYKVFTFKPAPAINTGQDQSNLLTIIAFGNTFYLYINRQFVGRYTDNAYTSGTPGLLAVSGTYPTADVAFSNLQIWKL